MTHPGLLYYFGTKERLLREVVAERERVEAAGPWVGDIDEASLDRLPDALRYVIDDAVLTRLYVVLAAEEAPPTLIWATKDGVYSSILDAVPDVAAPSPAGSGSPSPSGGASGSPGGSAPASAAP